VRRFTTHVAPSPRLARGSDDDAAAGRRPEASRPYFERLLALRDQLTGELGRPLPILSMGMSHDFEVAIACGATHVRIGTAMFGTRA
jgi:uncharacterized pyridoxal phosphate-containing UPF0001 family protein